MRLRLNVSKDRETLIITLKNIRSDYIKENAKGYYIDFQLKEIQLRVDISSVYSKELKEGKLKFDQFLLINRDHHEQFTLKFGIHLNEYYQRIKDNRVHFYLHVNEGIQLEGDLTIRKKQLEPYVKITEFEVKSTGNEVPKEDVEINRSPFQQRKKWNNARWENHRRQTYGALFYKFNKSMNRHAEKQKRFGHTQNFKVNRADLRKKGIYHDEFGDNKCDNCYYFRGDQCSLHLVAVTIDHACFKHRGYREIQGGAFSPK